MAFSSGFPARKSQYTSALLHAAYFGHDFLGPALLEGELEGSFSDWNVIEYHGTAIEVGLPDEAFERLAEELTSRRIWEIEEYLGQGNGIPLGLSAVVIAIYARIAKHGNDNLEEFAR